jgi:hypothetical protein
VFYLALPPQFQGKTYILAMYIYPLVKSMQNKQLEIEEILVAAQAKGYWESMRDVAISLTGTPKDRELLAEMDRKARSMLDLMEPQIAEIRFAGYSI